MKRRALILATALAAILVVAGLGAASGVSTAKRNGPIAFQRGLGIWVARPDGTKQRPLTDSSVLEYGPAWSHDGKRIAFASGRDGNDNEIYLMRADGSDQHPITNNDIDDHSASWSPDGKRTPMARFPFSNNSGARTYNSHCAVWLIFGRVPA